MDVFHSNMKLVEKKQEHEFFVVPDMNRNIILGRDWLKQFWCLHVL